MCFATAALVAGVVGGGISAVGAVEGGAATAAAANYRAAVAANNAIIEKQNATYAEQAGSVAGTTQGLKGAQVAGKIKAGQAAGGVDVNTGSNKAVQAGQREVANLDTATTVNNSELQAYGYRTKAVSDTAESQLDTFTANQAPIGADIGAAGSLLSSASSLSSKWNTLGPSSIGGGSGGAAPVWPPNDI